MYDRGGGGPPLVFWSGGWGTPSYILERPPPLHRVLAAVMVAPSWLHEKRRPGLCNRRGVGACLVQGRGTHSLFGGGIPYLSTPPTNIRSPASGQPTARPHLWSNPPGPVPCEPAGRFSPVNVMADPGGTDNPASVDLLYFFIDDHVHRTGSSNAMLQEMQYGDILLRSSSSF